jgi:hypothetical protein
MADVLLQRGAGGSGNCTSGSGAGGVSGTSFSGSTGGSTGLGCSGRGWGSGGGGLYGGSGSLIGRLLSGLLGANESGRAEFHIIMSAEA